MVLTPLPVTAMVQVHRRSPDRSHPVARSPACDQGRSWSTGESMRSCIIPWAHDRRPWL